MKELPRRLGLADAILVVAGTIIGSGIFLTPNLVARQLPSPWAILGVWLFGGLLSLAGALAYAELGAMIPSSGGQYAYLREAYGPLAAFLCGWTYLLVVITAAIAWLATSFGIYLAYFLPLAPAARKAAAVAVILALTVINYRGVVAGARVQNLLAILKIAGIAILIAAALASPVNHWREAQAGEVRLPQFGLAMVACLLTYDGWLALSLLAGEVKKPERNLPLGLFCGVGICTALYLAANTAYLKVLTVAETAQAERVAARAAEITLGPAGGKAVALIILLSILGAMNGWILSAPRIYFAQSSDGLFFARFAEVHPRFLTPGAAIVLQGAWAAALCLSGTYETLGSFAMFAAWIFYGFTVLGAMILRSRRPDAARPYRMWGYPLLPLMFVAAALGFVANTFVTDTAPALTGTALILAGVPAYFLWRKRSPVA
ncbi:MAG: amino acid permease [Acidobacteria bacterium]|nr:amino acid permease [Acidobacteriota bacterium]